MIWFVLVLAVCSLSIACAVRSLHIRVGELEHELLDLDWRTHG